MSDQMFLGGMEARRRGRPISDAPTTLSPGQQAAWCRGWEYQEKKYAR